MTAPAAAPTGKAGDFADDLVDLDPYDDGTPGGIPLYDWNTAPKAELATRRQLRAMGLRPGGHGLLGDAENADEPGTHDADQR